MSQWFLSIDGKQEGPFDEITAQRQAAEHPQGQAWREGMASWQPIATIPELQPLRSPAAMPPGPPPASPSSRRSDEVDYEIHGQEMQFVEIELDPGESAVAEAGAMMYKHPQIHMESVFGDASDQSQNQGLMGRLVGAGKRLLTGESLFMTVFSHQGQGKARVAFAAPFPGNILPLSLSVTS